MKGGFNLRKVPRDQLPSRVLADRGMGGSVMDTPKPALARRVTTTTETVRRKSVTFVEDVEDGEETYKNFNLSVLYVHM